MFGWGSSYGSYSARSDLEDYRLHYPDKKDEPVWDCLTFFRNETPMRGCGGLRVDDFITKMHGNYSRLESAHDFIQTIFPLREAGLNWSAQSLMRHEIATIRSDAAALRRVVKLFELMLDFYGFKFESLGDPELLKPRLVRLPAAMVAALNGGNANAASASASADASNDGDDSNDDDPSKYVLFVGDGTHRLRLTGKLLDDAIKPAPLPTPPNGGARIVRKTDPSLAECLDNLNTSSHNYLRITRICKALGEFGLEHLKIAFLECFERELASDDCPLYNIADSYERYFIGTIYDDQLRAAFAARAKEVCPKAKATREKAWANRGYGRTAFAGSGAGGGYTMGAANARVIGFDIDDEDDDDVYAEDDKKNKASAAKVDADAGSKNGATAAAATTATGSASASASAAAASNNKSDAEDSSKQEPQQQPKE